MKQLLSRSPLRAPDQEMEPQDGRIHLHREERHLHHRSSEDRQKIEEAYFFVREVVMNGDDILFVGTKKQAQDSIREEALRCGQFYANARWLGGMLTNFKTIQQRIEAQTARSHGAGRFVRCFRKKNQAQSRDGKAGKIPGRLKDMRKLPGAMFVVDPRKERNAILKQGNSASR